MDDRTSGPLLHLPAQRLFAGRSDVVALVVDPALLTDPVRFEPGLPGDPAAMRSPACTAPLQGPATSLRVVRGSGVLAQVGAMRESTR